MIDRDSWAEIAEVLRSNKLRTLLTASGIFWGVFILIVMLGFGNGIEDGVKKSMSGYATNAIYVWSNETSVPYQGLSPGRNISLNNEDSEALVAKVGALQYLAPRVRLGRYRGRSDVLRGAVTTDAEISGDLPQYQHLLPMDIQVGRFINSRDVQEKRKVVVIGERIHEELFGADVNPIGEEIQILQVSFTVVGIFKPQQYGNDRERMSSLVFTPLSTFQQVFNIGSGVGFYAAIPKDNVPSEVLGERMISVLKQRHRVAPSDRRAFGSWNSEKEYLRIRNLFAGIKAFLWTVGIATLLAGVLGVSNIMLISIRERRREFGIRKSIGATPTAVLKMVLGETATLVSVAGLCGFFFGLLCLYVIDVFTRDVTQDVDADVLFSSPTIDIKIAVATIVCLMFASLLATLIPARHAMRINPVEALRNE